MYVSLTCTACSCTTATQDKVLKSVAIGEVGELQFPKKQNEGYKISRFFPVIRRQHHGSQNSYALLPAGKIKLCIRVEFEKTIPDRVVDQTEIPKRHPFTLPSNFGEALQLKRKQLKATVVPEDISHTNSSNQMNLDASVQLLKEITIETTHDQINSDDLKTEGRIGEGIHSCVSFGILHGSNSRQVAVKEFRHQHAVPPVTVLRAFRQEYQILVRCRSRSGCHHVVELLGVALEPRLVILMDYLSHGSLAQCLKDEAAWDRMSIKQKVAIGLKIGQGIAWLHKHNIVHRDIKTHNILIGDDPTMPSPTVKVRFEVTKSLYILTPVNLHCVKKIGDLGS
ncbi:Protein kinase, partial [Phytophthora palmivora]